MDDAGYGGCVVVFSVLLFVLGLLLAKLQARTREVETLTDRVTELEIMVRTYLLPPTTRSRREARTKEER